MTDHCRALLGQRETRLFGRDPVDHVRWEGPGGVVIGAWQYGSGGVLDGTPWVASGDGFAMSTGHLRWPNGPWLGRPECARQLLGASFRVAPDRLSAGLRGCFTMLVARSGGHTAIGADPLGLRFVFYGWNQDVFVASSNATLAARALAPEDGTPARDPLGAAWLVFSGYRVDDRTGYEGVRLLPQGATIVLESGRPPTIAVPAIDPWRPGGDLRASSPDELVDLAREEIADTLRATAALPVSDRVVDLTGGKDSRLVLAVVLSEGLGDAFRFRTVGHDDLPDVRVAGELAERLGLRHASEFPLHREPLSYVEQLRGFIDASAGMNSISDLKPIRPRIVDEVQIAGGQGECLRLKERFDHVPRSTTELVRVADSKFRLGALNLLRPEVDAHLKALFRDAVTRCGEEDADPFDAMQSFHLRYRARKRGGAFDELHPAMRVLPLYSIEAIRVAFAMGGEARQRELVHFEIMKRVSDVLVVHPFAGRGWKPGVFEPAQPAAEEERRTATPSEGPRRPRSRKGDPPAELMARLTDATFDQRRHTWEEVLRDNSNPTWEIVDREAALVALDRFPSLDGKARRELLAAITAALWLGRW